MPNSLINIAELPTITDRRGCLTFAQFPDNIPFSVSRVYFIYKTDNDSPRGFHAHRELQQLMIAISGSFEVTLDDGQSREKVILTNPTQALLIDRMIWREMHNFSQDAICLVLASMPYDESDYIRNYDEFLTVVKEVRQ